MMKIEVTCRRCGKKVTDEDYKKEASACNKYRCSLQGESMRKEISGLTDTSPDDYIPVISGSVKVHEEPEVTPTYNPRSGFAGWNGAYVE